jgi:glycosyltransferase involved in cell wall biosynthesis
MNATTVFPRLAAWVRRPWQSARRLAFRLRTGESVESHFDIYNLKAINTLLAQYNRPPLTPNPRQASLDRTHAMRYILALLASSPRLRRAYPRALSAGPDGAFCQMLTSGSRSPRGLSPLSTRQIRGVFADQPGEAIRRILEFRGDVCDAMPLLHTPRQRGEFLGWFLRHGCQELRIGIEPVLWFLMEAQEDLAAALANMYLLQPDWQRVVPNALTPRGWPVFQEFLAKKYQLRAKWFTQLTRPDLGDAWDHLRQDTIASADVFASLPNCPADQPTSVNLLGHFYYPSGLQQALFCVRDALLECGVRVQCRNIPTSPHPTPLPEPIPTLDTELSDVSILVAGAHTFPGRAYRKARLWMRPGVYRIAMWYWELESVPSEFAVNAVGLNEVWAPTRFVAEAMAKALSVPVVPMLPGLRVPEVPDEQVTPRSYFGLDESAFVFLFCFDLSSTSARKNPLGLMEAYYRAFGRDPRVQLVLKISRGEQQPKERETILRLAELTGVRVIDRVYPRSLTLDLIRRCDCYVSLHRSEGLGLTMAEAMLLGKPTIATAYSGNLDFMDDSNSLLVRYEYDEVPPNTPHYPAGCRWAEPDVDHAAELMRWVYEHPDQAAQLGRTAQTSLRQTLDPRQAGLRMLARIEQLRGSIPGLRAI